MMPTCYTLNVDLKDVVNVDSLQSKDKKVSACKATKEKLEERFSLNEKNNKKYKNKLKNLDNR
ncbi:hypothetical protein PTKIN_Ptkin05aG0191000 [Pterospermum kingtungense]